MSQKIIPCVDVVMAVFNGADFMDDAMESVALQKEYVAKFIIIDDGSTDETAKKIQAFIARHPDLCIITKRQENQGASIARNRAIALGDAPYIAIIDADDMWQPEKLAKQLAYLKAHPDCALLGTNGWLYYGKKNITTNIHLPSKNGEIQMRLLSFVCFNQSSVVFRRKAFDDAGSYTPSIFVGEDYDLWLRMARRFKVANLQKKCIVSKKRLDSLSRSNKQRGKTQSIILAQQHLYLIANNCKKSHVKNLSYLLFGQYEKVSKPNWQALKNLIHTLTQKILERFPDEAEAIERGRQDLMKNFERRKRKFYKLTFKAWLSRLFKRTQEAA